MPVVIKKKEFFLEGKFGKVFSFGKNSQYKITPSFGLILQTNQSKYCTATDLEHSIGASLNLDLEWIIHPDFKIGFDNQIIFPIFGIQETKYFGIVENNTLFKDTESDFLDPSEITYYAKLPITLCTNDKISLSLTPCFALYRRNTRIKTEYSSRFGMCLGLTYKI